MCGVRIGGLFYPKSIIAPRGTPQRFISPSCQSSTFCMGEIFDSSIDNLNKKESSMGQSSLYIVLLIGQTTKTAANEGHRVVQLHVY